MCASRPFDVKEKKTHQFANNQLHNEHLKLNSTLSSSTQKDSLKIPPPVKASCASDTKVQAQDLAKKSDHSMSVGSSRELILCSYFPSFCLSCQPSIVPGDWLSQVDRKLINK